MTSTEEDPEGVAQRKKSVANSRHRSRLQVGCLASPQLHCQPGQPPPLLPPSPAAPPSPRRRPPAPPPPTAAAAVGCLRVQHTSEAAAALEAQLHAERWRQRCLLADQAALAGTVSYSEDLLSILYWSRRAQDDDDVDVLRPPLAVGHPQEQQQQQQGPGPGPGRPHALEAAAGLDEGRGDSAEQQRRVSSGGWALPTDRPTPAAMPASTGAGAGAGTCCHRSASAAAKAAAAPPRLGAAAAGGVSISDSHCSLCTQHVVLPAVTPGIQILQHQLTALHLGGGGGGGGSSPSSPSTSQPQPQSQPGMPPGLGDSGSAGEGQQSVAQAFRLVRHYTGALGNWASSKLPSLQQRCAQACVRAACSGWVNVCVGCVVGGSGGGLLHPSFWLGLSISCGSGPQAFPVVPAHPPAFPLAARLCRFCTSYPPP